MTFFILNILALAALILTGCGEPDRHTGHGEKTMNLKKQDFGQVDSQNVYLYTLTNINGLKAKITNYGGILTSLMVPDRDGNLADIVLGYNTLDQYIEDTTYFGAIVGRYANRIAKGKFTLNGTEYTLAVNNGLNHLHGGIKGFDKVIWAPETMENSDTVSLKLTYLSKDMEEGYPGNLKCTVIYTLTNDNELKISYEAETDKDTIINLTHHSYFNLAGHDTGSIMDQELTIDASYYTPVDDTLIPTGQILSVKHTPMDFTAPATIGSRIDKVKGGYDHNFILDNTDASLTLAATVHEPKAGRVMHVMTTQPAIQFYSGNFLDGSHEGKGTIYKKHNGLCLETQHYPDSPNKSNFPSVVLKPTEKYKHLTIYKFSTKKF
ncbi:MAG: aldose epimerase family protein [Planctomycetota bacterium]|jgi:aldose 1-epimerase